MERILTGTAVVETADIEKRLFSVSVIKVLWLFICLTQSIALLRAQDLSSMQKRLEATQKVVFARENRLQAQLEFEEYDALYAGNSYFSDDLSQFGFALYERFTQSGRKYGIIKLPTDTITKAIFENINGAFRRAVVVSNNNKLGMIDSTGKLVIPTQYDEITSLINDRCFVKQNGKYALATYTGKILTPFLYDAVDGFFSGICAVTLNKRVGFIDENGKLISEPQFNNATRFYNGFSRIYYDKWETVYKAQIIQNRKPGTVTVGYTKSIPFLINTKGTKVFSGKSGDAIYISTNHFAVIGRNEIIDGNKYYLETVIDTLGNTLLSIDRKLNVYAFSNEWIIVQNPFTQLFGTTDLKGKDLLKTSFVDIESLKYNNNSLGKAYITKENFFYIDKNCKCVEFDGVKCPDKD